MLAGGLQARERLDSNGFKIADDALLARRQHFGADLGFHQHLADLERGRSSHTSICFGVLTLPTRCFTKADTAATSTVRPALGCSTTATTRSAPLLVWQTDDGTILNGFRGPEGLLDLTE